MFKVGQRVYIVPIDEYGTICKVRRDDDGGLIYHVDLASGFGEYLCRESELAVAKTGDCR